jgi:hypothetical protein
MSFRHVVDFSYSPAELAALFEAGHAPIVAPEWRHQQGTVYITAWDRRYQPFERMGHFAFHDAPTPRLWHIDVVDWYTLADLLQEVGRLERQALGQVKHGNPPPGGRTPSPSTA